MPSRRAACGFPDRSASLAEDSQTLFQRNSMKKAILSAAAFAAIMLSAPAFACTMEQASQMEAEISKSPQYEQMVVKASSAQQIRQVVSIGNRLNNAWENIGRKDYPAACAQYQTVKAELGIR